MRTLADLVSMVAADLQDPDHLIWSAGDHSGNIRRAMAHYAALNPYRAIAVLNSANGVREYDIAELGAIDIVDVWYPYNPDAPGWDPQRVAFWMIGQHTLYIDCAAPPTGAPGGKVRVFYLAPHRLAGLDEAADTTLDMVGVELVVLLATASAAMQRCQAAIGQVTVTGWTPQQLLAWANVRQGVADRAWETLRRRLTGGGDARVPWDVPLQRRTRALG